MGSQAGWHQAGPRYGNQVTSQGEGEFCGHHTEPWCGNQAISQREGEFCGCHVQHSEGKQTSIPWAETETVVAGKEGCLNLCPLGPQPLLVSNRPQIVFGEIFLLKYSIHAEKCTHKWQLSTFSQRPLLVSVTTLNGNHYLDSHYQWLFFSGFELDVMASYSTNSFIYDFFA